MGAKLPSRNVSKYVPLIMEYIYFDVTKSFPFQLNWYLMPVIRHICVYVKILILAPKNHVLTE